RPAVERGDGVFLVGDQVASPGVLSEVSFTSALTAVSLALGRNSLDPKHDCGCRVASQTAPRYNTTHAHDTPLTPLTPLTRATLG
ncbi:hypothetical protein ACKI2B_46550, partial [Streptomyces scabiei]